MLKMSSLRVMVKRSREKKQQKGIEKQQFVIVTENNLFKGLTAEGVRNYYQINILPGKVRYEKRTLFILVMVKRVMVKRSREKSIKKKQRNSSMLL